MGISFKFDYEEWCQWWEEELGQNWFLLRGCKKGKYVMARHGDRGGYEVGNVKCILHSANVSEKRENRTAPSGSKVWCATLTEDEVLQIFKANEKHAEIAKQFNVTADVVRQIRNGKNWSHVTGCWHPSRRRVPAPALNQEKT